MLTHSELVTRAAKWLSHRCKVVLTETIAFPLCEIPDVIGFDARGYSTLIECKTSRADFNADKHKPARRGGPGVGFTRLYFCEQGIIDRAAIPDGWGLLELRAGNRCWVAKEPSPRLDEYNIRGDMCLLIAELARVADEFRAHRTVGLFVGGADPGDAETSFLP